VSVEIHSSGSGEVPISRWQMWPEGWKLKRDQKVLASTKRHWRREGTERKGSMESRDGVYEHKGSAGSTRTLNTSTRALRRVQGL